MEGRQRQLQRSGKQNTSIRVYVEDIAVLKARAGAAGTPIEAYIEALVMADDSPVSDEAQRFLAEFGGLLELNFGDGFGAEYFGVKNVHPRSTRRRPDERKSCYEISPQ